MGGNNKLRVTATIYYIIAKKEVEGFFEWEI